MSVRTGRGAAAWVALAACACVSPWRSAPAAEPPAGPAPLPVVEAGTVVEAADRDRWNRIVMLATPRFSSGDVADVSAAIRDTVTRFTFTVLATVRESDPSAAADDGRCHQLVEVGIGYSTPVNGRLTVIAPDARLPGFSTDFLGRQILSAKHKSLGEIVCVGRHARGVAFDAPIVMRRDEGHEDLVVRHLVRIDPRSGKLSTWAWLLEATPGGGLAAVEEPLRIIDGGTREERAIHVDGSLFSFGFPTKRAFALEDLPPGRRLDWPASLREAAADDAYPAATLERISTEFDAAVASLRTLRSAER